MGGVRKSEQCGSGAPPWLGATLLSADRAQRGCTASGQLAAPSCPANDADHPGDGARSNYSESPPTAGTAALHIDGDRRLRVLRPPRQGTACPGCCSAGRGLSVAA
nr:unnamed protein product [Digitaria exilis]